MAAKSKAARTPRTASRKAAGPQLDPTDLDDVSSPTGLAHHLAATADALSEGLETGNVCAALDRNLALWIAIKTLAERRNGQLDPGLCGSLRQVAETVADTTFALAQGFSKDAVEWLIRIDLDLSRKLTDAIIGQMTRDRAYFLWQEAGAPHGDGQQFWFAAEREIRAAMAAV